MRTRNCSRRLRGGGLQLAWLSGLLITAIPSAEARIISLTNCRRLRPMVVHRSDRSGPTSSLLVLQTVPSIPTIH